MFDCRAVFASRTPGLVQLIATNEENGCGPNERCEPDRIENTRRPEPFHESDSKQGCDDVARVVPALVLAHEWSQKLLSGQCQCQGAQERSKEALRNSREKKQRVDPCKCSCDDRQQNKTQARSDGDYGKQSAP